jgi:hypothetical protein
VVGDERGSNGLAASDAHGLFRVCDGS